MFNFLSVSSNQVSLRMLQDWNQAYADSTSAEYKDLKERVETQVGKKRALSVE